MNVAFLVFAAVVLDWLLGEPKRFHPLIGFGRLASYVECNFNIEHHAFLRSRGIGALMLLIVPFTVATYALTSVPIFGKIFGVVVLYFALGHRSLHDHARPVAAALMDDDEGEARHRVSLMVSRDPETLDIKRSVTESVLENGNDAVFGALFWFAVAGAPGTMLYRLANTLDAMWGHRNQRFLKFGWAAARFDDVLNYVPSRLTALTYALLGQTRLALKCWRVQAPLWDSPNAGPVMASGAGALNVCLGGPARYHGEWHERPILGAGQAPEIRDIERALRLVRHGVLLWLIVLIFYGVIHA